MRKEQSRGITIPDFEIQYKAILIKTKTDIQVVEQDRESILFIYLSESTSKGAADKAGRGKSRLPAKHGA